MSEELLTKLPVMDAIALPEKYPRKTGKHWDLFGLVELYLRVRESIIHLVKTKVRFPPSRPSLASEHFQLLYL